MYNALLESCTNDTTTLQQNYSANTSKTLHKSFLKEVDTEILQIVLFSLLIFTIIIVIFTWILSKNKTKKQNARIAQVENLAAEQQLQISEDERKIKQGEEKLQEALER